MNDMAEGIMKAMELKSENERLTARNEKLEAVYEAAKKHADALNADQCWGESGWSIIELDDAIAAVQTTEQVENDE